MDPQPEHSPFADTHATRHTPDSSRHHSGVPSSADDLSLRSTTTFGTPNGRWVDPSAPLSNHGVRDSVGTLNAAIGSARRVLVGFQSPVYTNSNGSEQSARRLVAGMPVAEPKMNAPRVHQRGLSFASEASSRADSILESFPFVPPSPISSIPPRSPLGQQSFRSGGNSPTASAPRQNASPTTQYAPMQYPPEPPTVAQDRRALAVSSMSRTSTGSSGLDQFPFELHDSEHNSRPPLPQLDTRASLDTLALSRDLEAFPLNYDVDSGHPQETYMPSRKSSTTRRH